MKILVVGGLSKSPIAGIRALARAGHQVDAAVLLREGRSSSLLRFCSRYASRKFSLINPLDDEAAFTARLLEIVRGGSYDAILPWTHAPCIAVTRRRAEFAQYTGLALPEYEDFMRVHDKEEMHRYLRDAGFDLPEIYEYTSIDDLRNQNIRYPVAIKARRYSGVARGIRYANTPDELERGVRDLESIRSPNEDMDDFSHPFVQEYIPGKGHDGLFLFNRGKMRAAVTQVRHETYPLSGGVGITNITTDEPALRDFGRQLLETLNWHGPCQVEVKKDLRDGKYKLMEINPRFWGTVDLSVKAGINFPELTARMAVDGDVPETYDFQVGVRYRFLYPQTFMVVAQNKGNRLRRLSNLVDVLGKRTHSEVDIRDLGPNLLEMAQTAQILLFNRKAVLPESFGVCCSRDGDEELILR